MAERFVFEPGDIAPDENAAKVQAALQELRLEDVVDPSCFDAGYRVLDAHFGPIGEIERREVLDRWFAEGSLSPPGAPIEARYHMLLARDSDSNIVGVRDCFTALDRRVPRVVVLLSHSLVLPSWRRSGLAALLRAVPAVYARRDANAAGFDQAETTLVAEMEPLDPRERDSVVRLLSYGRAGFRVAPPELVPYAQPDFRDLDALGEEAQPIPMMFMMRQVGEEEKTTMSWERLFATLAGLGAIHSPSIRASQLHDIRRNIEARTPPGRPAIPLLATRVAKDLAPLLRSRVLPLYPAAWRGKPAAEPEEELRLLAQWSRDVDDAVDASVDVKTP